MRILLLFLLLSAVLGGSLAQKFVYMSLKKSWTEAQMYCRHKYTDLATITHMTEQTKVASFTEGNVKVWIGLYRVNNVSPWIWSDQSDFLFHHWAVNKPDIHEPLQTCVSTNDYGWVDKFCTEELSFVCYSAAVKKTQVLRVEVESHENVNDPEVKKNVLEKIQQALEGNVTLSWRNQSDGNVFQKKQQNKDSQHTCH
ncbi:C-type lectin BPL [Triplophysa rosa]|nr:C-type lectin BPL [Triplophysa rosa]